MNAFGSLRINVNRLMQQHSVKVLLITSPSRGDGKTMISLNLADAFAASGRKWRCGWTRPLPSPPACPLLGWITRTA